MAKFERIMKLLACPDCRNDLKLFRNDKAICCSACGKEYPIINEVPVLFGSDHNVQTIMEEGRAAYENFDRNSLKERIKLSLHPPSFIVARPTLHDQLRDQWVFSPRPEALILNLGSGTQNELNEQGMLLNFDIYPHYNTDIAGDAHCLPFQDNTLDGIWCCAVLEHLAKPWIAAREMHRVLKPGGFVLVTVPFIQPRHGSPHDYFRYTVDGLRSLFSDFKQIQAGATGTGPFGTWAEITVALFSAFNNRTLSYGVRVILSWCLYPIILLDKIKLRSANDSVITGGSCYLGVKQG